MKAASRILLLVAFIASVVLIYNVAAQSLDIRQFLPVVFRPIFVPAADQTSERLKLPAGFVVRNYASGLKSPRLMTVGPDGALYVAERGLGRIVRLADANNDGLADAVQPVATNLDDPHSVEWSQGALYVAETASAHGRVIRLVDTNKDGDFMDDGEKQTITENIPGSGGHSSRTAHIGPDGKLYVSVGSTGNNNVETDKRRAAILRFNLDGSIPADNPFATDPDPNRRPVWAEGLRNAVDFVFMPNGQLWADHNGSDGLGNDVPPEEIVINVEKGKHYGWPFCYTAELGAVPATSKEVHDSRVNFAEPVSSCDQVLPALFTDLAHQAPLGMALYTKKSFPAEYQGNLFVAYHGSWNADQTPRDCKVQMIKIVNNLPVSSEPFLTGFRDTESQECGSAWGRPAGVAVGQQGELFVSDDQNGNIYRIVYAP